MSLAKLAERAGVDGWMDHQAEIFEAAEDMDSTARLCLHYPTGAGKTLTSLGCLSLGGYEEAIVIAPPATHKQWQEVAQGMGIKVLPMSHAKFRMKSTLIPRAMPVIADEFHLFGGHDGQGWKKLDRLAQGLQAPMILASATPNYNDAERVYCIQHILDPLSCRGGFIQFLYQNCTTENNPFGMMPIVTGFRNYPNAASYLESLPGVFYLPDELQYTITDHVVPEKIPPAMEHYGYNPRRHRMIASIIEEKHARIMHSLIDEHDQICAHPEGVVLDLIKQSVTPVMIFANHSTVAEAMMRSLMDAGGCRPNLVTGSTTNKNKQVALEDFKSGEFDVLIGTATLATGPDGLDKVCDTLIILDDTEDDSLRRQLIGRIMPRGADTDASKKQVHRLVLQ